MGLEEIERLSVQEGTKDLLRQIVPIVEDYAERGYSMTVRQLYYQLVSNNIVPNNLNSYQRTSKILTLARTNDIIEWEHIVDNARIPKMADEFESVSDFIEQTKYMYRRKRWADQDSYVEVVVEKDALSGILLPITTKYHVSLLANKGYSSSSAVREMAIRTLRYGDIKGKRSYILYLGDHDPSGIDMKRDMFYRLFHFGAESYDVHRIALTTEQIEEYDPPPNPAKMTDPRAEKYVAKYGNESWELDALDPDVLAGIVEEHILRHMDVDKYDTVIRQEERDLAELEGLVQDLYAPKT